MARLDLGNLPDGFKRGVAAAGSQVADGVSRVVGDASGGQLERVMRTPLRRVALDAIFWQLPKQLDRKRAKRVDATARWRITQEGSDVVDVYDLTLREGECWVHRGESTAQPRVTITIDGVEFLRLVTGNSDPLQAYFKRRMALSGDLMFAAKLVSLFRMPKGRPAPES